jgi:hypothetical protein
MERAKLDLSRNPTGVTFVFDMPPCRPGAPPAPADHAAAPSAGRGARITLRRRRAAISARIDRLLTAVDDLLVELDAMDGDENLEIGGDDEHSLALGWGDVNTDREQDDDDEPSLGAPELYLGARMVDGDVIWPAQARVIDGGMDQSRWGRGALDDREAEHDGRELATVTTSKRRSNR